MKFTIVGAGAIGGITGSYLARAGHDVTLVDTVAEHPLRRAVHCFVGQGYRRDAAVLAEWRTAASWQNLDEVERRAAELPTLSGGPD